MKVLTTAKIGEDLIFNYPHERKEPILCRVVAKMQKNKYHLLSTLQMFYSEEEGRRIFNKQLEGFQFSYDRLILKSYDYGNFIVVPIHPGNSGHLVRPVERKA